MEERWYASYTRPSLLVHEFHFSNNLTTAQTINFAGSYPGPSPDFAFQSVNVPAGMAAINGSTLLKELPTDQDVRERRSALMSY